MTEEIKKNVKLKDIDLKDSLVRKDDNNVLDSIKFDPKQFKKIWNELKPKHQCFILEYLKNNFNGGLAYSVAYNREKTDNTCYVNAYRLLRNTKIQKALAYKMRLKTNDAELSIEWVLKRLKLIVDRCLQEVKPIMFYNKETKEYEETGEFQFNSMGANKALDSIGKYFNMFTENIKLSGDKDNPIKVEMDFSNLSVPEIEMLQEVQRIILEKCKKKDGNK
jgi:phage terminase small subunit